MKHDPAQPETTRVIVTVEGETGTGKSRIMAEIEVALTAAGITVEFASVDDRRATEAEHWSISRGSGPAVPDWPLVLLREVNIPRPVKEQR